MLWNRPSKIDKKNKHNRKFTQRLTWFANSVFATSTHKKRYQFIIREKYHITNSERHL